MQLGFFIVTIVALSRNFRLYIVNTFLDFPLLLCYYFFFSVGLGGGGGAVIIKFFAGLTIRRSRF